MIQARLKSVRTSLGLTQKGVAEKLCISARGYQVYEDGHSFPGGKVIEGFVNLGVNANWLLTGEGDMFLVKPPRASCGESFPTTALTDGEGFVAPPLYNAVFAFAGHGALLGDEQAADALMFKESWIKNELGAQPADLCLLRVSGNSMEPTLSAGDVILINRRETHLTYEGIYVLRMGDSLLVKNLQALPGGQIRVKSDNPAYEPFMIATGENTDVVIVGRVVWTGRKL